jgi:hypothetical protein
MKTEITKELYSKFVEALRDKGISCKTKLMKDEVVVECGRDFPDKLFDKIHKQATKLNIQESLSVCAEQSGGEVIDSDRINGGPKNYW